MSLTFILLVAAFICFICAAAGVGGRVNLTALGLAFWILTVILGGAG